MTYLELDGGMIIESSNVSLWPEATVLTKAEGQQKMKDRARESLLETLSPGNTVYTVLRHVSQSGMSRRIDLYTIKDNQPVFITGSAGRLMGYKHHKDGGLVTQGCGMDMGFDLVYNLGRCLWPAGTDKPHGTRNGEPDSDGGYALNHKWL